MSHLEIVAKGIENVASALAFQAMFRRESGYQDTTSSHVTSQPHDFTPSAQLMRRPKVATLWVNQRVGGTETDFHGHICQLKKHSSCSFAPVCSRHQFGGGFFWQ
jgi:hypothetical protein